MKRFFSLLFLFFLIFNCHSQDFLGYVSSSFAGVNGIDLNPASIVNNPRKWDIDLVGLNLGFGNNFLGLQHRSFTHTGSLTSGNYPAFNDQNFQNDYLTQRNGIKSVSVFLKTNVTLASFMFVRSKHKDAFAFTCKARVYTNVGGIDPTLAHQLLTGVTDSSLFGQKLPSEKLSVQAMAWMEYGFTYGKTIMETSNERLNVAGRLKLLQGLYAAYFYIKNANYKFYKSDSLALISSQVDYGHSTNLDFNKQALGFGFAGKPGVGLDLGATYEFHPLTDVHSRMVSESKTSPMMHEYKYKIGFSVQDLGWITYLKPTNARDFSAIVNNNINTNSLSASGAHPMVAFDDSLSKKFPMNPSDNKFRMSLPTVMSLQGDYYAGHNIYLNSTIFYALQFNNNIHEITTFSITPRWDWKWIGTYFPVSYDKYNHLRAGISVRLGPLILGTANILPIVAKNDIYGADFFFLLKVPHINFKKKTPRSRSKFDVNDKPQKPKKHKQSSSDMPKKDTSTYEPPNPEKESKSEHTVVPAKREKKTHRHIFPRLHLFKKKHRHTGNPQEEHTIYFKI